MTKALTLAAALVLLASGQGACGTAHAGILFSSGATLPSPPWDGTWPDPPAPPEPRVDNYRVIAPPVAPRSIKDSVLPPPEWDYPFPGKLIIVPEKYGDELKVECGFGLQYRRIILGCIHAPGTMGLAMHECRILLGRKSYIEYWYPVKWVMRHEIAHCNGWRHGIETAEKPTWPRVAEKPKADVAENPKVAEAEKPSAEKKVAKPKVRKSEPPRRPAPDIHSPFAVVATALSTPFYVLAAFTGRGPR